MNSRGLLGCAIGAALSCGLIAAAQAVAREAPPVGDASLQIQVTGVKNGSGRVHIDLCRQAEFLKDCPVHGEAKAVAGTTIVTIAHLQPGIYAAQIFHDENANGRVDRGLFGIPKEGVGFSNDAPIRLGPPKWADAMFTLSDDKVIKLKLRYFGGTG